MKKWILVAVASIGALASPARVLYAYEGGKTQPHTHQGLNSGGNSLNVSQITVSSLTVVSTASINSFVTNSTVTFTLNNFAPMFIGTTTRGPNLEAVTIARNDNSDMVLALTGVNAGQPSLTFYNSSTGQQIDVGLNSAANGGFHVFDNSASAGNFNLLQIRRNRTMIVDSSTTINFPLTVAYASSTFKGVIDGVSPAAGNVGEIISLNAAATQQPTASNTWVALSTITLTAGDWDITGSAEIDTGGTTASNSLAFCLSTTNNGCDSTAVTNGGRTFYSSTIIAGDAVILPVGPRQVNITSNTVYYLTANLTYTVLGTATYSTNCRIQARRMR